MDIKLKEEIKFQVLGQKVGQVVKVERSSDVALLKPLTVSADGKRLKFKRTAVNLNVSDVAAKDTIPANKPKLDFKPHNKGKKIQPSQYFLVSQCGSNVFTL